MSGIFDPIRGTRPDTTGIPDRTLRPTVASVDVVARWVADGFGSPALDARRQDQLRGTAQPVRTVQELHPSLERVTQPEELPGRFAADLALVRDQVLHPRLALLEGLSRLWRFAGDYAEKYIALRGEVPVAPGAANRPEAPHGEAASLRVPTPPQLSAAFTQVLYDAGFHRMVDAVTRKDGISVALELLSAPTVADARRLAEGVRLIPAEGQPGAKMDGAPPVTGAADTRATADARSDEAQLASRRTRRQRGSLTTFLRERLWPDWDDERARSDYLFWGGIVVLCGMAVLGALLRWLL